MTSEVPPTKARIDRPDDAIMTVGEVAAYLRMSIPSLHQTRRRHGGPAGIKIGSKLLFKREDVECWLARFAEPPTGRS